MLSWLHNIGTNIKCTIKCFIFMQLYTSIYSNSVIIGNYKICLYADILLRLFQTCQYLLPFFWACMPVNNTVMYLSMHNWLYMYLKIIPLRFRPGALAVGLNPHWWSGFFPGAISWGVVFIGLILLSSWLNAALHVSTALCSREFTCLRNGRTAEFSGVTDVCSSLIRRSKVFNWILWSEF